MKQFYEGAKGRKQIIRNTHDNKQFYEGAKGRRHNITHMWSEALLGHQGTGGTAYT